jgi:ferredoxin-NADP reductase
LKVVIKNSLIDLLAFGKHIKLRKKIFNAASAHRLEQGYINTLSRTLHPARQDLIIESLLEESPDIKTFRLVPVTPGNRIASFRAGQYLVLSFEEEGMILNRPFSISSSPGESREGNYYDISIKRKDKVNDGFFSDAVFRNWIPGSSISASGPQGACYYEPLRDASQLVCIAGGSGITPFRSILTEELENHKELKATLFYGMIHLEDYAFAKHFETLAEKNPGRLTLVPVVQESPSSWQGYSGFIDAPLIRKELGAMTDGSHSFFLCGPPGLHQHMEKVLSDFSLRKKYFRRENYGEGTKHSLTQTDYQLNVFIRGLEVRISASSKETLLTSMERHGLEPPAFCRSGECGWCRSQLVSGEIAVDPGLTGLRMADRKFGWIHPCVSYPLSPITLRIPDNPHKYSS